MNVNYNLLKTLDALLSEVHVTRAGEKLFLTQAATSNALNQLRSIFDDPLLLRGQGSKMRLTPLAQSLKPKVREALEKFENIFEINKTFNPDETEKVFHIGMTDYIESILLSKLIDRFYQQAPKAKLKIHHLNYLDSEAILETGELDIVLGNCPTASTKLKCRLLFTDDTAFFARTKHPVFLEKDISFKKLLEYPLIMVDYAKKSQDNYLDKLLQDSKYKPKVNVTVPHAYNALNALLDNDFITHSAIKLAQPFLASNKIRVINPIKQLPKIFHNNKVEIYQYWHQSLENNKANIWLRELISALK